MARLRYTWLCLLALIKHATSVGPLVKFDAAEAPVAEEFDKRKATWTPTSQNFKPENALRRGSAFYLSRVVGDEMTTIFTVYLQHPRTLKGLHVDWAYWRIFGRLQTGSTNSRVALGTWERIPPTYEHTPNNNIPSRSDEYIFSRPAFLDTLEIELYG